MKITEIRKRGKGDRFYIYVDGGFFSLIEAEIIAKSGIKTGQEVDESYLNELLRMSGELSAFAMAADYVARGLKSEKTVREYLKKKKIIAQTIDKTLDKFKNYGYINDEEYVKSYVNTYSHLRGKFRLRAELRQKGVPTAAIEESLAEIEVQPEVLSEIALKYLKNKERNEKSRNGLVRHILSRGFSYEEAKRALTEIWED